MTETQNTQSIIVSYENTAPTYLGWQTGEDMSLMLNRVTGDVYSIIEE